MKKISNLFAVIFLLALSGCDKKPLPVAEPTQPLFYFDALLNGNSLHFEAGNEAYYMNSSHFYDTTSVYVLKAELKQNTCTSNCGYGLTVLLNDKKISASTESINMSEALKTGEYMYNDRNLPPLYYSALLRPVRPELSSESYKWMINGQEISGYTASTTVENRKSFSPTFLFQDGLGLCDNQHSNTFKVGNPLQTVITAVKESQQPNVLQYRFNTTSTGFPPYIYSWQFGDGSAESTEDSPLHVYADQGFYSAKLRLIDAKHDTCYSFYQVPAFVDPKCEANFTATFTPLPNTKAFAAVTILLTDPNGKVYTSKDLNQPEESHFEIIAIEDYIGNEHMEPTKKFKVKFNCTLQNGNDRVILTNASAVLAVSYK